MTVLCIAAARIDHAHHSSLAQHALEETSVMDAAVRRATELTSDDDTLLVVTGDHAHVFTFGGYHIRGNPILGE